jgi:hypothetical protein
MTTHDPTPDPCRDDAVQWIMHALTPMLRPGVNEDGRLNLPGDGELETARRLFGKIVAALEEAEAERDRQYDENVHRRDRARDRELGYINDQLPPDR